MAVTKYTNTKFASSKVVATQIEKWEPAVVQCRSWRHPWSPETAIIAPKSAVEVQHCPRCGAYRHRYLDPKNGSKISDWSADLPMGYSMPRGSGRIAGATFDQVRLAALHSVASVKVKNDDELHAELRRIIKGE